MGELVFSRRTTVESKVKGKGYFRHYVLVLLIWHASLSSFNSNDIPGFIRAVLQQLSHGRTTIRQVGEFVGTDIGLAYVIEVIGHGKAMANLKTYIHFIIKCILHTNTKGNAKCHSSIRSSVRISRSSLSFCSQWTKEFFFTIQVCIWIIAEDANTQRYIRSKSMIGVTWNKLEEVEITL